MRLLLLEPKSGQNIADNSPSIGNGVAGRVEVVRSDYRESIVITVPNTALLHDFVTSAAMIGRL